MQIHTTNTNLKFMPLLGTYLDGTKLVEEIHDGYGLYKEIDTNVWKRIDSEVYSLVD